MFTTVDDERFFLDPEPAAQIARLGINVREPFTITKRTSGRKGEPVSWEIQRIGTGPHGVMAIPRDPEAAQQQPAPKPAGARRNVAD